MENLASLDGLFYVTYYNMQCVLYNVAILHIPYS